MARPVVELAARVIVLDTGAFVAADKRSKDLTAMLIAASEENVAIVTPASVFAEAWREPPRYGVARLLGCLDPIDGVLALDKAAAKAVGALNGGAGMAQIADAHVVVAARRYGKAVIVTSDRRDIEALVKHNGGESKSRITIREI